MASSLVNACSILKTRVFQYVRGSNPCPWITSALLFSEKLSLSTSFYHQSYKTYLSHKRIATDNKGREWEHDECHLPTVSKGDYKSTDESSRILHDQTEFVAGALFNAVQVTAWKKMFFILLFFSLHGMSTLLTYNSEVDTVALIWNV
jgi:hypothetical protein